MNRPENFIYNSDFSTLKNDDSDVFTFTLPGSRVVPSSSPYIYVQTEIFDVGETLGATQRIQIITSREPDVWYSGPTLQVVANGTFSSFGPSEYPYYILVSRTGKSEVTVRVLIPNGGAMFGAGTLTTEPTSRTIGIRVATFIPPFS